MYFVILTFFYRRVFAVRTYKQADTAVKIVRHPVYGETKDVLSKRD